RRLSTTHPPCWRLTPTCRPTRHKNGEHTNGGARGARLFLAGGTCQHRTVHRHNERRVGVAGAHDSGSRHGVRQRAAGAPVLAARRRVRHGPHRRLTMRAKRAAHTRAVISDRQAKRMRAGEDMEGDPNDYVVNRTPEAIALLEARRRLEDRRVEKEIDDYFSL